MTVLNRLLIDSNHELCLTTAYYCLFSLVLEIRRFPTTKVTASLFGPKLPEDELRFEVLCRDRIYQLAAGTTKEKASWVAALTERSGVAPSGADKFGDCFKGFLWRAQKSGAYKRQYVVLADDKKDAVWPCLSRAQEAFS